ncbi:ELL2 factor, partial [Sylvia borin]|nr:ELL2 factor [Sylvia borin]
IRKYVAIFSLGQHQRYKDDFNAECEEHQNLHTQIDKMKKNFRQFHEKRKSQTAALKAYQVKKDKTMKAVLHHSSVL